MARTITRESNTCWGMYRGMGGSLGSLPGASVPIPKFASFCRTPTEITNRRGKPDRAQPRYLANAASKAVTPISPAAQKLHLFILCSALDNSVTLSDSFMPSLMLGKRHVADLNQNIAEPHAAMMTAVSMNDRIVTPEWFGSEPDEDAIRATAWSCTLLTVDRPARAPRHHTGLASIESGRSMAIACAARPAGQCRLRATRRRTRCEHVWSAFGPKA